MSYRDRLVNASFRGVPFLTESHEAKFGRRLVVHEFPGADLPLVEDFGAKAVDLHVNAYFIGENYDLARNRFLFLLQQPGADWLVHPWLGRLQVRAKDWTLGESNEKGGFCTVGIDFVPAGTVISQPKADLVDTAVKKLDFFAELSSKVFALEKMGSQAINGFIAKVSGGLDVLRNLISVARLPITWAHQIVGQIQAIKGEFSELLALPSEYTSALRGVFGSIFGADAEVEDIDRPRLVTLLSGVATRRPINGALLVQPVTVDSVLAINVERDKALQAVFLTVTAGKLALADYRFQDPRDTALRGVIAALDFLLPQLPDDVFQAAVEARVALFAALMAQVLETTAVHEVVDYLPSVVLAHQFDIDEADFVAINHVTHSLFVRGVLHG